MSDLDRVILALKVAKLGRQSRARAYEREEGPVEQTVKAPFRLAGAVTGTALGLGAGIVGGLASAVDDFFDW